MHIAAHSITDLKSARSVLKALQVPKGMVFEVPQATWGKLYFEIRGLYENKDIQRGTWIFRPSKEMYITQIQIVPASRLNFHRYKNTLWRPKVLPPASSTW